MPEVIADPPADTNLDEPTQLWLFEALQIINNDLNVGQAAGTFTTTDGKTVTVANGRIVSITP